MLRRLPLGAEVQLGRAWEPRPLVSPTFSCLARSLKKSCPVTLPPGRARLATRPKATGSPGVTITIGMAVVAPLAANAGGPPVTTIRSTLRRTRSAASSGRRSFFPSTNRYSIAIFFRSIHPSLVSSCRNASERTAIPEAVLLSRKPMRRIFPVCCASADEQSAKSIALSVRTVIFFFISFSLPRFTCHSTLDTRFFSLDYPVCSHQHVGRNRQADLLGGFQIDDELEFLRLLHREIGGLGAFEDLVDVNGGAPG